MAILLVGGCGDDKHAASGGGSSASRAPTSSSKLPAPEVFAATVRDHATKPYRYVTKFPPAASDSGTVDPASGAVAHITDVSVEGHALKFMITIVGADEFIKIEGVNVPGAGGNWVHVDPAKMPSLAKMGLASATDPTGLTVLQKAVVTATRSGATVTGTFDATRVGDSVAGIDGDSVPAMGDNAKAIPFEEALDANGQLSSLRIDVPAHDTTDAESITTAYTALGSPATIAKPDAFVEATAAMYQVYNS
jgi:hypothetical protein